MKNNQDNEKNYEIISKYYKFKAMIQYNKMCYDFWKTFLNQDTDNNYEKDVYETEMMFYSPNMEYKEYDSGIIICENNQNEYEKKYEIGNLPYTARTYRTYRRVIRDDILEKIKEKNEFEDFVPPTADENEALLNNMTKKAIYSKNKITDFKQAVTKPGMCVDRIDIRFHREHFDLRKRVNFPRSGNIVISKHGQYCFVSIQYEVIDEFICLNQIIMFAYRFLASIGLFKPEINKKYLSFSQNELLKKVVEDYKNDIFRISGLEIAFDFNENILPYIKKSKLKRHKKTNTYYTTDQNRPFYPKSLVCIYDRADKLMLAMNLFRLEFRFYGHYMKYESFKLDLGTLNEPFYYIVMKNIDKIAKALLKATNGVNVFNKLYYHIKNIKKYELLRYILELTYPLDLVQKNDEV